MPLSREEREKLEQAFNVIRSDAELARNLTQAVENKWWHKVKSIIEEVLRSLGHYIEIAFDTIFRFFTGL